jgi:regulator of cell morphogenesis and NO signaling
MNGLDRTERISQIAETPVGTLVVEGPHRSRLLEERGIDYCCGGRRTLEQACRERGLRAAEVAAELLREDETRDRMPEPLPGTDWSRAPLTELCAHIERTHHDYLRAALPRIASLTEKVAAAHGSADCRLVSLHTHFAHFRAELEAHTRKEETVLFPWIRSLEAVEPDGGPTFGACCCTVCGDVAEPIQVMLAEHDDAGAALRRMRALTDDFTPPPYACNTYRALLAALTELEADMHQHVHKENNILFPRALELQAARFSADIAGCG